MCACRTEHRRNDCDEQWREPQDESLAVRASTSSIAWACLCNARIAVRFPVRSRESSAVYIVINVLAAGQRRVNGYGRR
jgi:hypothetical protein